MDVRKVPWPVYAALAPFALILWAFLTLIGHKAESRAEAAAHGEPVLTREIDGHAYALYFHRARPHFNTVEKDGARIFDSRDVAGSEGCVWELIDAAGRPTVRCYRPAVEPPLIERALP